MRNSRSLLCLLPILFLVSACGLPDSHAAPQATPTTHPVYLATATLTPAPAATDPATGPATIEQRGRFSLTVPAGYHALEGIDGGCFLYPTPASTADAWPGFLVLYPAPGSAAEILTSLLNATADARRLETPLEVDVGGLTFAGLFLETSAGDRLFLAAADGWALVAQGPADRWATLAVGLNQALTSLSFEEETR
jgi:hypothetical protein